MRNRLMDIAMRLNAELRAQNPKIKIKIQKGKFALIHTPNSNIKSF